MPLGGTREQQLKNVNGSPGKGPGRDPSRPRPRPTREEPRLLAGFRDWSFSARVQRRFADGTRQVYAVSGPLAAGSGYLTVRDFSSQMLLWLPLCTLRNTQVSEETRSSLTESSSRTSSPIGRRESPAGSRSGPARYVEVGGSGGNGWWQRRPPAEGAGNDRLKASAASERQPDRPLSTGTCLLRRITGSGRPMLGDSAALSAESGEVRYGRF